MKYKINFIVLLISLCMAGNLMAKMETQTGDGAISQNTGQIPVAEMTEKAEKYLNEMNGILDKVLAILKETRKEKDVIKLNCVNDKLTAIKGLIKVSEMGNISFKEAIVKDDKSTIENEITKISISYQKIKQLQAEAEACIGEMAVYTGETKVEVEMDKVAKELESEAMTESGGEAGVGGTSLGDEGDISNPPAASPFQ